MWGDRGIDARCLILDVGFWFWRCLGVEQILKRIALNYIANFNWMRSLEDVIESVPRPVGSVALATMLVEK